MSWAPRRGDQAGRKAHCDQLCLLYHVNVVITHVDKKGGSGKFQGLLCSSGHQRAALASLWNRVEWGVESEELIHFLGGSVLKATGLNPRSLTYYLCEFKNK